MPANNVYEKASRADNVKSETKKECSEDKSVIDTDSTVKDPDSTDLIFSSDESLFYHQLYTGVISKDCRTETLESLYRYSQDLITSGAIQIRLFAGDYKNECRTLSDEVNSVDLEVKIFIGFLVWTELQCFSDLITALCTKKSHLSSRTLELCILEILLSTNGLHQRSVVNAELTFGDTPIIQACRSHDFEVIRMLLRHGADVSGSWLEFENPVELLLFSPTQRFTTDSDVEEIERCLTLMLMVLPKVNIQHLDNLSRLSYHPLHPDWKNALLNAMSVAWDSTSKLPSLQHICRYTIRKSIRNTCQMVNAIDQLSIPRLLKDYTSLKSATASNIS